MIVSVLKHICVTRPQWVNRQDVSLAYTLYMAVFDKKNRRLKSFVFYLQSHADSGNHTLTGSTGAKWAVKACVSVSHYQRYSSLPRSVWCSWKTRDLFRKCHEISRDLIIWFSHAVKWIQGHDDVITWKHFPFYRPFVKGIRRSPVDSFHKVKWRQAFIFSLICALTNGWASHRDAGDLRSHCANNDVTVMAIRIQLLPEKMIEIITNFVVSSEIADDQAPSGDSSLKSHDCPNASNIIFIKIDYCVILEVLSGIWTSCPHPKSTYPHRLPPPLERVKLWNYGKILVLVL